MNISIIIISAAVHRVMSTFPSPTIFGKCNKCVIKKYLLAKCNAVPATSAERKHPQISRIAWGYLKNNNFPSEIMRIEEHKQCFRGFGAGGGIAYAEPVD